MLRPILAAFVLLVLNSALLAQEALPSPTASTIKVEVRQVLVPVVVTDRKGHHVTGLKASDFRVLEEGVPQKVVAFSTEAEGASDLFQPQPVTATPTLPPAPPSSPPGVNPTPRRTYLICIDTLNSAFGNFAQVRGALRKLFREERSPDSQYALLALGRQVMIIQNLTRDPVAMLAAIDNKDLTKAIQQSESTNLLRQESELTQKLGEYCRKCSCDGSRPPTSRTSSGTDVVCSGEWAKIEMWGGSAAQERTTQIRELLRDLRRLAEQLSRLPGKRSLILVSDGFNLRPGRDLFGLMAVYVQDPGVLLHNPAESLEPEVQEILRAAAARDVTFYTLDSRGLYGGPSVGYDATSDYHPTRETYVVLPALQQEKETMALEDESAMRELAEATGGVFFHNSNDLLKGMRQSFTDGREYYVLAYASANQTADGRFREIKVEVKGRNLLVRAKRGYWAPAK